MTVADVQERVEEIEAVTDDPEDAHIKEDLLWEEVLEAIASGVGDPPADLARVALATREIRFPRWCS